MTTDNVKNSAKEFDFVKDEPNGHDFTTTGDSSTGNSNQQADAAQRGASNNDKGSRQNAATINVSIADQQTPIVILFGPSQCGKTMTLVRLTRYLSSKYSFVPDKAFKDSSDDEYKALCDNFDNAVDRDEAADGTNYIDFMLLRVNQKRHGTICQFLESPGEYLFDPDNKDAGFPGYFQTILDAPNRRIWVFFLEPTLSNEEKKAYVKKITQNITFGNQDRFIFLVNKIDMPITKELMTTTDSVDEAGLRRYVDEAFKDLTSCEKFSIEKLFSTKELYRIIGFQTGTYTWGKTADGNSFKTFHAGHDSHPKRLWQAIEDAVNGEW